MDKSSHKAILTTSRIVKNPSGRWSRLFHSDAFSRFGMGFLAQRQLVAQSNAKSFLLIPDLIEICGHHFLSRGLGPDSFVLDLGANRGEFAREMRARWGVRCLSIEANPLLCKSLCSENEVINVAVARRPEI